MAESSNSCGNPTDAGLKALATALDSAHLIAFVPSLFVDWVTSVQSGSECAAIRKLIDEFLWPMALDVIAHPIMNRVRRG